MYAVLHAVYAYVHLLTDAYPPFDLGEHDEYPVRLRIAPPKPAYSRLRALLRLLIGIPVYIIYYAMSIIAELMAVIAWFAIVFTGRQPQGIQKGIGFGIAYIARTHAYFSLLVEDWPPFSPRGED